MGPRQFFGFSPFLCNRFGTGTKILKKGCYWFGTRTKILKMGCYWFWQLRLGVDWDWAWDSFQSQYIFLTQPDTKMGHA